MALTPGFWEDDDEGTADRMNLCLMSWGLDADKPSAGAATLCRAFFATDTKVLWYDNGTDMVEMGAQAHDALDNVPGSDPHTQYQLESEIDSADGYPALTAGAKVVYEQFTVGTGAGEIAIGDHTH